MSELKIDCINANIYGMNSEANGDEMCITIKNGTEPYAVLLIETRYSD